MIRLLVAGEVERIIITDKDRLLRFGAELIFDLCLHFGVEVEILNEEETEDSFEVELAKDVILPMTVFTAKLYGKRSGKNKRTMAV